MNYVKSSVILSMFIIRKQKGGTNASFTNKRKIIVNGSDQEINTFRNQVLKYLDDLKIRNVQIIYKKSPQYQIELYGYDGELKKHLNKLDLEDIIKTIDNMPIGKIEKTLRDKLNI